MVAKKTPAAKTDETKAPRKPRTPKPVDDLASATVALNAAKRKADRTAKARAEAVAADGLAQTELEQAKATVKRFYAELMGETLEADEDVKDDVDADLPAPEDNGVDDYETSDEV